MAEEVKTELSSDIKKLEEIFQMDDEKRKKVSGIKEKLVMPDPEKKDYVDVRILMYQEPGKEPALFKHIPKGSGGGKFRNDAVFLNVEEVNERGESNGVQKDMNLSTTLHLALDREMTNRQLTFADIVGKVFRITASYWTSAPRAKRSKVCPQCNGTGCQFCTVTGTGQDAGVKTGYCPPTRYNAQLREDLTGTPSTGSTAMEF